MIVRASRRAFAKCSDRFDSDVHARVAGVCKFDRNRLRNDLVALDRLVTVDDLMISRQKQLRRPLLPLAS